MDNKKLLDGINDQMNFEIESAYIYKAMAIWCDINNWKGYGHFLYMQEHEELEHAEKMKAYLLDVGYDVKLAQIAEPKNDYKSLEEIFETALEHEKLVTSRIKDLYKEAREVKDYATQIMLQWFITEQVEEEDSFEDINARLARINGSVPGLYMFERELAARQ